MNMKITVCLLLIYLASVFGHHQTDSENQRSDENFISSDHSREDHHAYDDYEHEARRKYDTSRILSSGYKRIPAIRRTVPEEHDHDSSHHKHSDSERGLHHEDDDHHHDHQDHHDYDHGTANRNSLLDSDAEQVDYQPEVYPNRPAPPVVFFGPQRRQIRLPVYQQRPSFSRFYDVNPVQLPVAYRTINPVAYSVPVPRVRNVVLGVPSVPNRVRYTLGVPSSTFDNGGIPVEYRGIIAEEFDDFLKKK